MFFRGHYYIAYCAQVWDIGFELFAQVHRATMQTSRTDVYRLCERILPSAHLWKSAESRRHGQGFRFDDGFIV